MTALAAYLLGLAVGALLGRWVTAPSAPDWPPMPEDDRHDGS